MREGIAPSPAEGTRQVPLGVRIRLARAAVQTIADDAGVDVLHIKGDAVDPRLGTGARIGTDVDVLIRPAHVQMFHDALVHRGWRVYTTFEGGSPFGHAQTYWHPIWGYLDLHRRFPGIQLAPSDAFDRLWAGRQNIPVAEITCQVPNVSGQAVVLLLNAARARSRRELYVNPIWRDADPEFRARVAAEIEALDARVAFDALLGNLEAHRGAPQYRLWKVTTRGGTRAEEWLARIEAAPTLGARIRLVVRAPLVNVTHLEHVLGRKPTRTEVAREFFGRPARGLRELARRARRGV